MEDKKDKNTGSIMKIGSDAKVVDRLEFVYYSARAHMALIKQYVVLFLYNQRQWSANTKTRGEVKHSKRKVRKQKGSGQARLGSFVVPQCVGGGRVGGPSPKFSVNKYMNTKENKKVFVTVFEDKILNEKAVVLEEGVLSISIKGKTRVFYDLVIELRNKFRIKSLAFLLDMKSENAVVVCKMAANIPNVYVYDVCCVNSYDVLVVDMVFVSEVSWNMLLRHRLAVLSCQESICSQDGNIQEVVV